MTPSINPPPDAIRHDEEAQRYLAGSAKFLNLFGGPNFLDASRELEASANIYSGAQLFRQSSEKWFQCAECRDKLNDFFGAGRAYENASNQLRRAIIRGEITADWQDGIIDIWGASSPPQSPGTFGGSSRSPSVFRWPTRSPQPVNPSNKSRVGLSPTLPTNQLLRLIVRNGADRYIASGKGTTALNFLVDQAKAIEELKDVQMLKKKEKHSTELEELKTLRKVKAVNMGAEKLTNLEIIHRDGRLLLCLELLMKAVRFCKQEFSSEKEDRFKYTDALKEESEFLLRYQEYKLALISLETSIEFMAKSSQNLMLPKLVLSKKIIQLFIYPIPYANSNSSLIPKEIKAEEKIETPKTSRLSFLQKWRPKKPKPKSSLERVLTNRGDVSQPDGNIPTCEESEAFSLIFSEHAEWLTHKESDQLESLRESIETNNSRAFSKVLDHSVFQYLPNPEVVKRCQTMSRMPTAFMSSFPFYSQPSTNETKNYNNESDEDKDENSSQSDDEEVLNLS